MKKVFKIIYSSIFVAICCTPLALMPFIKNDAKIEKRELTALPPFMIDGRLNTDFSTQFESWFNDRIPLRSQMLSASNIIKSELLHTPSSNVINGKGGWLFYENEAYDYMDSNAMTDDQAKAFAVTLSLLEEKVTNDGGKIVFVPCPNKASVYGEYMPYYYREADTNNLTRVMGRLSEYGVNFVDLRSVLTDAKGGEVSVYHRRDSHWNNYGAIIGFDSIMDGLGKTHKDYLSAPYTIENIWRGDIDKLLYPEGGFMDDQYVYDIKFSSFMFQMPRGVKDTKAQLENFMSDKEEGDSNIMTQNMTIRDGSRLYMVRDSFGRALLPFFIDSYQIASFRRTEIPDLVNLSAGSDFVYEIVERNLIKVISKAPLMYAPERASVDPSAFEAGSYSAASGDIKVSVLEEGYGVKIYGLFSDRIDIGDARVYVAIEGSGIDAVYEAFPICEFELLEVESGNGFSLLLPTDMGLKGDYKLSVITGGSVYDTGTVSIAGK